MAVVGGSGAISASEIFLINDLSDGLNFQPISQLSVNFAEAKLNLSYLVLIICSKL